MKRFPKSKHLEQDKGQVVDVSSTVGYRQIYKESGWQVEEAWDLQKEIVAGFVVQVEGLKENY